MKINKLMLLSLAFMDVFRHFRLGIFCCFDFWYGLCNVVVIVVSKIRYVYGTMYNIVNLRTDIIRYLSRKDVSKFRQKNTEILAIYFFGDNFYLFRIIMNILTH